MQVAQLVQDMFASGEGRCGAADTFQGTLAPCRVGQFGIDGVKARRRRLHRLACLVPMTRREGDLPLLPFEIGELAQPAIDQGFRRARRKERLRFLIETLQHGMDGRATKPRGE